MTHMTFPKRRRYDFICALDCFRACDALRDERTSDAIELLQKEQKKDGLWQLGHSLPMQPTF